MNIITYLVLLIVLLVVLCIIGILALTFHTCIISWCCNKNRSGSESAGGTSGLRNQAFNDQEEAAVIRPRPFNTMEQVETPPSYEEAVRQEFFRFRPPLLPSQRCVEENSTPRATEQLSGIASTSSSSKSSTSAYQHAAQSSSPTSQRHRLTRTRSSTACSSTSSNLQLTTINEEEDECPIQVVIDCIGIQTARLIENCDTTVQLTNGHELKTKSNC